MSRPITRNLYVYGNANPLKYVDPTGHISDEYGGSKTNVSPIVPKGIWEIYESYSGNLHYNSERDYSKGDDVIVAQKFLTSMGLITIKNNSGEKISHTGNYYTKTRDSVKKLQQTGDLDVTGTVNTETWAYMGLPKPKSLVYDYILRVWEPAKYKTGTDAFSVLNEGFKKSQGTSKDANGLNMNGFDPNNIVSAIIIGRHKNPPGHNALLLIDKNGNGVYQSFYPAETSVISEDGNILKTKGEVRVAYLSKDQVEKFNENGKINYPIVIASDGHKDLMENFEEFITIPVNSNSGKKIYDSIVELYANPDIYSLAFGSNKGDIYNCSQEVSYILSKGGVYMSGNVLPEVAFNKTVHHYTDKEIFNPGLGGINVTGTWVKNSFYNPNVIHGYFGKDKFTKK